MNLNSYLHEKMDKHFKMYVCEKCELVKNRDLNAAENLDRAGLVRIQACGYAGSVSVPWATEASSMDEVGSGDV